MGDIILEIKNLTKKYGSFKAVDGLSLTIEKGQVFGILGPNGSGKTTTLGMVLDVINVTEGSYAWFGGSDFENHRKKIGSILEHPIFYPELSAYRNLEISCGIKEVSISRIDQVLDRVGLLDRKNSKFRTYSLGMKQRLALAAALLADPDVLVLDEPTNGLDPQGINQMRGLIKGIANEGKTIIISSHLLDEIQKICSHVAILKNGKLLKVGEIGELVQSENVFVVKSNDLIALQSVLEDCDFISDIKEINEALEVSCHKDVQGEKLNEYIVSKGIYLSHLKKFKVSLEDEFLNIIKNNK